MCLIEQDIFVLHKAGKTNWRENLSTIDLLFKVARLVKSKQCFQYQKQLIVQGGQSYWTFPFSKGSLQKDALQVGQSRLVFPWSAMDYQRFTNWRGRLSTVDLLIKVACLSKAADLNYKVYKEVTLSEPSLQ